MFKIFGILVANRVGAKGIQSSYFGAPFFQFFTIFFRLAHGGENNFIKLTRAGDSFKVVKNILGKSRLSDSSHSPFFLF